MILFHLVILLQLFYKASKERFDNDAEFKDRAQQAVVRLQVSWTFLYVESGKITVFSHSLLSNIYYVGRGGEISFCLEKDMWNQQERIWPGLQALRCTTWRKGSITFYWYWLAILKVTQQKYQQNIPAIWIELC